MKKLKKGQKVIIYQDPLTELKQEGEAILVKLINKHLELEGWQVKFISDGYTCARSIKVY